MSFSNNVSRTTLKENAYGTNLTLTGKLVCSEISNTLIDQTVNILGPDCTGTNTTLEGKLTSSSISTTNTASKNLFCQVLEIGDGTTKTYTFIDMKTKNGNTDYDVRINVDTPYSSTAPGKGLLTIDAGSCAINAPLTVNSISTPGNITASGDIYTNTGSVSCKKLVCSDTITTKTLSSSGNTTIGGDLVCNNLKATSGIMQCMEVECLDTISTQSLNATGDISCDTLSCTSLNIPTLNSIVCNTINQSHYYTIRGSSTNYGVQGYTYQMTFSDGTTSSAGSFSIVVPSNCITFCVNYCYYTDAVNQYGITPYYFFKTMVNNTWHETTGSTVGTYAYQPASQSTTTIGATTTYTFVLPTTSNISTTYFTCNIWFY